MILFKNKMEKVGLIILLYSTTLFASVVGDSEENFESDKYSAEVPLASESTNEQYQYDYNSYPDSRTESEEEPNGVSAAGQQNTLRSSPGCPRPELGSPYVYYFGGQRRCYLVGEKGPCPENMVLFAQRGSAYGYCDCNCDSYMQTTYHSPRIFCKGRKENGDIRTLAYVRRLGSCQPLLEQGYCTSGFWLTFDNDPKQGPMCTRALCDVQPNDFMFYDYTTGKCQRLGGRCEMSRFGYSGTPRYQITESDWSPVCTNDVSTDSDIITGRTPDYSNHYSIGGQFRRLECPYDEVRNPSGRCQARAWRSFGGAIG